jgi:hypothetical protein
MKQFRFTSLAWFIIASSTMTARCDLTTNLSASADTSLFETNPDMNLGGGTDAPSGTTAGNGGMPFRSRALYKFDLSQLPPNATVTAASLVLTVTRRPSAGTSSTFGLHRILRAWGEGAGIGNGSAASDGDATWNNRLHPSTPWTPAGGGSNVDYVATASASDPVDVLGPYTWSSTPALVADVQAWIQQPGTNFGWMLISSDEGTPLTARRFGTREGGSVGPVLTVQYTVASAATPPTISQISVASNQIHFVFTAEANRTYAVEYRATANGGTWQVLTNIPAQAGAKSILISDSLSNPRRFYRVRTP